jgi:hypothetical protein
MQRVVVGELGKWEKINPTFLLVTKRAPEVLFQDLVNPLHLSISFGMIGLRQINNTTKRLQEALPEMRNEL